MRYGRVGWAVGCLVVAAGCGKWLDDRACSDHDCVFSSEEWTHIQSLANVGQRPPRPDPSNKYLPIVDWKTRALRPGADQDLDGTLVAVPLAEVPEVRLGWRLYYETALSGSRSDVDILGLPAPSSRVSTCGQINVSCATCHDPARYGSDFTSVPRFVSIGAGWYDVNIQQTLNVARFPVLYWNGRADVLWAQAAQVMESPVSMNGNRMKTFWVVVGRYWQDYQQIFADTAAAAGELADMPGLVPPRDDAPTSEYMNQFNSLTHPDQETVTRVHVNVAKAIAAYEWLLGSDGSAFDRFVNEGRGSNALSPAAERGLKLFVGRGSCIDCHNTPLFSDGNFHNIGIPQKGDHVPTVLECVSLKCDCRNGGTEPSCLPAGAHAGQQKLAAQFFRRGTDYDDNFVANREALADAGATTGVSPVVPPNERLIGAWRTPSLRDVAMTPPYMHDGSFATLGDVVWHYDQGGGEGTLGTSELAPLHLTAQDRDDLVAFLQSLTGTAAPTELVHAPPGSSPTAFAGGCPSSADGGAGDGR